MTAEEASARLRRLVFVAALAACLVRPAIALLVELPGTPVARGLSGPALRSLYRPGYLDQVRGLAPDGDVFLSFELPAGAEDLAASIYYRFTYDLHPRRVRVTDRPAVINDGRDLLREARTPDPQWLAEQGVRWLVRVSDEAGRLHFAVLPARKP
jgi:hypothetical protein